MAIWLCLLSLLRIKAAAIQVPCKPPEYRQAVSSWKWNASADRSDVGFRLFLQDFRAAKAFSVYHCAQECLKDGR